MGRYYKSEDYISHSDSKKGIANKLYHVARVLMLEKKLKSIKMVTGLKKGKLLDIGSGTGYFINHIKSAGWDVRGIEQDSDAATYSIKNFGLDVKGPDELYKLENQEFDVITMWHVLEHVHDLDGYMKVIGDNLKNDGTLVLALPNHKSVDAKKYGEFWAAWDVPRHIWHFSPETLEVFAKKYAFKIVHKLPMPLDAFYVSMLSEKYKGAGSPMIPGFVTGIKAWFKTLNDPMKSSSIIYFLKKA